MSRLRTYLELGRVSNVPTVWSNVVAATVLAAPGELSLGREAVLSGSMSLFYVGGMFLNDAFDRDVDARERPERPIPSGRIGAGEVYGVGFGLLLVGLALVAPFGWKASGSAIALGAAIVAYDAWHKQNPVSPLLMGLCRVLVYTTVALPISGALSGPLWGGAAVLLSYLIGLTYVAKQETLSRIRNLWPLVFLLAPFGYAPIAGGAGFFTSPMALVLWIGFAAWVARTLILLRSGKPRAIPRAVVSLIAGIALSDALLAATAGAPVAALAAALAFPATLVLQRWILGT